MMPSLVTTVIAIWLGTFPSCFYTSNECKPFEFYCGTPFDSCLPLSKVCDYHCDCLTCNDESRLCGSRVPLIYHENKTKKKCFEKVEGHNYGVLSSPGFPRSYPRESDCSWLINLGKYVKIEFRREFLNLADGDYLIFYDGSSSNDKILGKFQSNEEMRIPLVSSSGNVLINLKTGISRSWPLDYKPYKGFNITYQIRGVCIPGIQLPCKGEAACFDVRYDKCTGVWQCPLHGTDELDCPNCPPLHYFCWFDQSCYSPQQRCDGKPDCKHRRDELNCDPIRCGAHNGTFLCASGGHCIYESWRCDGAIDCADGSDETGCSGRPTSLRVVLASVVGSLLCALLIVITISYLCKVHALRNIRANPSMCEPESPFEAMMDAEFRNRRPPPSYDEAMRASLLQMRYNLAQSMINQESAASENPQSAASQMTRLGGSTSLSTYTDIDPYENNSSSANDDIYSMPHTNSHSNTSISLMNENDDVPCILATIAEENTNSLRPGNEHSYYSLDSDPYDVALINPGFENEEGCDV